MTDYQYYGERNRRKNKKSVKRNNAKRTIYGMLIAPIRFPRLSNGTIATLVKSCETCGVLFVIALLICMVNVNVIAKVVAIISGILFGLSFIVLQLQMYQNNLEQHGYDITGKAF